MKIKITFQFVLAFLLLTIVSLECHEIVHISVGRIICGCWGERDFNVWSLCEGCDEAHSSAWLATLAGPLFSFTLMWLGVIWLSSQSNYKKAVGFSLIFSNIPFGRITTVMMGGGDEMVVLNHFFKETFSHQYIVFVGSSILLLVGLPPIIRELIFLKNKMTWLYILGFMTVPLFIILVYILGALNSLLSSGFLNVSWVLGTPLLITIHTLLVTVLLLVMRKQLVNAFTPA